MQWFAPTLKMWYFESPRGPGRSGVKLHGWFVERRGAEGTPCGALRPRAVGEHVADQLASVVHPLFEDALDASVFVFDYRGYGKSDGTAATRKRSIADGMAAAQQWLAERTGIAARRGLGDCRPIAWRRGCRCGARPSCGAKALILENTFGRPGRRSGVSVPVAPGTAVHAEPL